MARIDWSVLSGPRVSRRTLLASPPPAAPPAMPAGLAASAAPMPTARPARRPGPGRAEARRHAQTRLRHQPDPEPRPGPGQPRHRRRRARRRISSPASSSSIPARSGPRPGRELDGQRGRSQLQLHAARRADLPQRRSPQGRRHRLHLRADDRPRLRLAPRQQAGADRVGRYPDDLTVNFTLSAPFAPFLAVACSRGPGRALTPISRRAFEEMGEEQFDLTPVGAVRSPSSPRRADLSSGFELVAFDGWYGGRPLLDGIEVTIIAEPSSRISALEAGDVDMLDIVPAIGVAQLIGESGLHARPDAGNELARSGHELRPAAVGQPGGAHGRRQGDRPGGADRDRVLRPVERRASAPSPRPSPGPTFRRTRSTTPQAFNLEEAKALAESAGIVGAAPTIMATADDAAARRGPAQPAQRSRSRRPDRATAAGRLERALAGRRLRLDHSTAASPTPTRTTATGTSSTPTARGTPTATTTPRSTTCSERRARPGIRRSGRPLFQRGAGDPAAGRRRTPSSTTPSTSPGSPTTSRATSPIPEMRYLETVWLDR